MSLLQSWYGLSDYEVEDRINDSLSFSYFCGLNIEEPAPDHSTLSRFRTHLTKTNTFERLFKEINSQLETHGIIVKKGVLVDASVIDTPLRPKGKKKYKVANDREESDNEKEDLKAKKEYSKSVDKDGTWLKKRGKYHFGYKKHHVTDEEGLVLGVVTTIASLNEITNLEDVLESADLPENIAVKADKGYQSKKMQKYLKNESLRIIY